MLDICLLGTGGMMPLPYRWLTSMMARCADDGALRWQQPSDRLRGRNAGGAERKRMEPEAD